MRVMDRPHNRHDVSAPVKVLAIARASPVRGRESAWEPSPDHGGGPDQEADHGRSARWRPLTSVVAGNCCSGCLQAPLFLLRRDYGDAQARSRLREARPHDYPQTQVAQGSLPGQGGEGTVSEAVFGLLGALGGALITAAAAYWGPWRVAQAAREEAWLVDARARRDAEISRIILMRTTARTWRDLLADSIAMLGLGVPVDRTSFEEKVTAARNAAQSAFDHALHDGIWIPQGPYGSRFAGDHPVMYEFNRLTDLVRSEIETVASGESVGPLERERLQALLRAQGEADAARGSCPPSSWSVWNG